MRVKFGPWMPDQPDLDSGGLEECTNAIPTSYGYTAIRQDQTVSGSTTVAFAVQSLIIPAEAGAYMFVASQGSQMTRLFLAPYNSGGAVTPNVTSTDVGRTATYTHSTSAWSMTQFGPTTVYAVNGYDEMQVGSTTTNFRDQSASASAPRCKVLSTVRDFVFAGNIISGGVGAGSNRVQWCQINNPQRWTPNPRLQSDYQDLPDTGDVMAITGGDFAAIFTRRAVWRATYVGSPIIFRFDQVAPNVEIAARASAARYQNMTFFLSRTGFQLFDGQQCIPIGSGSVDRFALEFVERQTGSTVLGGANLIKGVVDNINKLYVVALKNRSDEDILLLYNFVTGGWSKVAITDANGSESPLLTNSLLLAAGTTVSPDPVVFHYTTDRRLGVGLIGGGTSVAAQVLREFHSTSFMTATFATGETQIFSDRRGFVTGVRPLIQGDANTTITVEVGSRDRLTQTTSYASAVSVNSNGLCPQRVNARYHRVRVNVAGGFERAIGFDLDARPEGRR